MTVLDSSALLAFVKREPGWGLVGEALEAGAVCSAATWSEVAQKAATRGVWRNVRSLLLSFGLGVEPVTAVDAEAAAAVWESRPDLPLADRLCLALAERLDARVLTADTAWGSEGRVQQIR